MRIFFLVSHSEQDRGVATLAIIVEKNAFSFGLLYIKRVGSKSEEGAST